MSNDERRFIELDIDSTEDETVHVNKADILEFFKSLKTMPTIDKDTLYHDILRNKISLPEFEIEQYYLNFCLYKEATNDTVIIQDFGSDTYYYIQDEKVFKCNRYEAQEKFYGDIAGKLNLDKDEVHDTLIDKLKCYETILLSSFSKYLSSLDDFIEDNIYMFDAAFKEKAAKNNSKMKI